MSNTFRKELQALINSHSKENSSDTPDYILAEYLESCLNAFDHAVQAREIWHGRPDETTRPPWAPKRGEYALFEQGDGTIAAFPLRGDDEEKE